MLTCIQLSQHGSGTRVSRAEAREYSKCTTVYIEQPSRTLESCAPKGPLASRFYPHTKHSFPSLPSSTPGHCLACPHLLCSLCTTERGWGFSKPGTWWGLENTLETHRAHPAPSHRASHTELCHTHWAGRMAGSSGSCLELTGDKAAASLRCNFHTLEKYITSTSHVHTHKGAGNTAQGVKISATTPDDLGSSFTRNGNERTTIPEAVPWPPICAVAHT